MLLLQLGTRDAAVDAVVVAMLTKQFPCESSHDEDQLDVDSAKVKIESAKCR